MNDREAIFDYIESDSPRAAILIDNRIETQVELLTDTPEIGRPGRIAGTRELVIPRTPYIAAYRIERETITVLRILHGAQEWPDAMEPR
jgi:addiction module RelE/StbE family toxin